MYSGQKIFDEISSQLNKGISSTNYVVYMEFQMSGFLAIHVDTALTSTKLFNHILNALNTGLYHGPISFFPNNETLEV